MHSKVEILLNEAQEDFKLKLYNKCASSAYFAARMALEFYIKSLKIVVPKRDDKLANVAEHLGFKKEAEFLRILYELRKKADYRDENISEFEAKEALTMSIAIVKTFKQALNEEV